MEARKKETTLLGGGSVSDVQLFPNGRALDNGRPACIFTCRSEEMRDQFMRELAELVDRYTYEEITEIE